ncbi:hypothetical protein RYR28_002718 [Edwardsiella piscicida]|uniref:hypothetical protein n=1 Tax=Edwardsiella piscicida TaxID=1263550 RepID=UPI00291327F2|nr:hypothetical protein [Edwardsiella piscicida]
MTTINNNFNKSPMMNAEIKIIDRTSSNCALQFNANADATGGYDVSPIDSYHYLNIMAKRITDTLNCPEVKSQIGENRFYSYHPAGSVPSVIIVPSLADRAVTFKVRGNNGQFDKPAKTTHRAGTMIISEPVESGILFSWRHDKYDTETMGTVSELTLRQELETMLETIDQNMIASLVKYVEQTAPKASGIVKDYPAIKATSERPKDVAEAVEEAIYMVKTSQASLGTRMKDWCVALSVQAFNAIEFIAKRSDAPTVEAYLGCPVAVYASSGISGYMVPKRHVVASFAEDETNGEVFKAIVTRDGNRQCSTLELSAVCHLVCAGFTSLEVPLSDGSLAKKDVALPLIGKFSVEVSTSRA